MKKISSRLVRLMLMALLLIGYAQYAQAEATPWTLNHYQHTAFTKKDGAPQEAVRLAETSDGYLWAIDAKGLTRFDGQHFQPFLPLSGEKLLNHQIRSIFASRAGGLWVSYSTPGVSFINHGHITNYENPAIWPDLSGDFFQDRQGNVMTYTSTGLLKFVNGEWKRIDDGSMKLSIEWISQDSLFNIWAATSTGRILVLREGETHFKDCGIYFKGATIVSAMRDHSVFIASSDRMMRRFRDMGDHLSEEGASIPYDAFNVVTDRRGNVWVGTVSDGVHFLGALADMPTGSHPISVDQKLDHTSGLSGNVQCLFEDNQGSIWVGTDRGLDRFTPSAFSQIALPEGISTVSIAPGKGSDVWIGSENFKVLHYDHDKATPTEVPWFAITNYLAPSNGTEYMATANAIWQVAPGRPAMLAKLPVQGNAIVKAITREVNGKLWVSFRNNNGLRLASLEGGKWTPLDGIGSPMSLHTDADGIVWAGMSDGRLIAINRMPIKQYGKQDGFSVGRVKVIAEYDHRLWLGGDRQLQVMSGGSFRTLKLAGIHVLEDISGLVFDQTGNLWVHTLAGLFRIDYQDIQRALVDQTYALPYRLFDSDDGVPGVPAQVFALPTLALGGDGRLWISGQWAAAWIDPQDLPPPPRLRIPTIDRVSSGQVDFDWTGAPLKLPKDVRSLQISYTTPELTFPARIRYQYRLRGLDDTWQDAGDAREAVYPHLSAGDYRFEVRSTYVGHAWADAPTAISFTIAPKYFETWWFRVAIGAIVLVLLWIVVRAQIRQATNRERKRMQIRLDERSAVARDLHDTLLQSTQALVLQLDALANGITDTKLKGKLERIAGMSKDAMEEGRDKVQALRTETPAAADHIASIDRFGQQLSSQYGIRFDMHVSGTARPLSQIAHDELIPIVSELLINAFRHARADAITVNVAFRFWQLVITVTDNGVGIDEAIIAHGAPQGHWGIRGVQERAARIGARIQFERLLPHGTRVVITVRRRGVYAS